MSSQLDRACILDMYNGAFKERVDCEIGSVVDNCLDPNTKANAKRKITVTLEITPSADRTFFKVDSHTKVSLAPKDPVTTGLYVTTIPGTGELVFVESAPQVPGQLGIDGEEQAEPKVLKFEKAI